MIVPHEHPVTPEWRAKTLFRMAEMGLSVGMLAREIGTSAGAISHVLNKAKGSSFVPRIDAFLAIDLHHPLNASPPTDDATPAPTEPDARPPEVVAEIALAREARDAITDDIVRLEDVRAHLEERLAEAYEHRAMLDVRIRTLRESEP